MARVSNFIVKHFKVVIFIYLIFLILGAFLSLETRVNIDNLSYLPDSMESKIALKKIEKEFGIKGNALLMIHEESTFKLTEIKGKILKVNGVKDVIWLDNFTDTDIPYNFISDDYKDNFYKDYNALMTILFDDINDSSTTYNALNEIQLITQYYNAQISGPSIVSKNIIDRTNREIPIYTIIAVILIIIILIIFTTSWLEPIIFLITIGTAISINMGMNIISGEISQTTFSSASLLQLAVSMDYMIFLVHRFHEYRDKGNSINSSIINSIKKSYPSIIISGMTTIAGFSALVFMGFGIGSDLGFVLARGVTISLITVTTLLPSLIILFSRWIEKTTHKELKINLNFIAKHVIKFRYIITTFIIILSFVFYLANQNIDYYYSNEKTLPPDDTSITSQANIDAVYKNKNTNTIIFPEKYKYKETELVKELENLEYVEDIKSLYFLAGTEINNIMLPKEAIEMFQSNGYSLINFTLNTNKEDEKAFSIVEKIKTITKKHFNEYYITGESFSYKDLKDVTDKDFFVVTILSTILIFLILSIAFKSISIPIIAIINIQAAIWINVGISYFTDTKLSFISFIIIGAIQLGSTVDYAILYINRYKENILKMPPRKAAVESIKNSGKSIITSGLILIISTFTIYYIATVKTASELCLLISRGALISVIIVFISLPGFLVILNPIIRFTTKGWPKKQKMRC